MTRALKNRRVAVLVTDGFEKVELSAEVDIVSLRDGRIRGVNLHEPASRVRVTCTIDEASAANYDALLVPGGFINPDLLRQSAAAREFVRAFDVAGKPIATLCHGGIFDTFADDNGRQAHLAGLVAQELHQRGPDLFSRPPVIERIDVLACKLP